MNETFIRQSVGDDAWHTAVADLSSRALPPAVVAAGLTMAEQVALYTWTRDTSKGPWFSRINRVLRMAHINSAEFETVWPLVAGIKSALDKLPPFEGVVYRAIKESGMTAHQLAWFKDAYQPGKRVVFEGFAGTAKNQLQMLRGRFKLVIASKTGRDISALSSKPDQSEVLMRHATIFEIEKVSPTPHGAVNIWAREI